MFDLPRLDDTPPRADSGINSDSERRVHQQLAGCGITVGPNHVSRYRTFLDMAGASLTVVRVDDEIEDLLAAPAEVAVRVL